MNAEFWGPAKILHTGVSKWIIWGISWHASRLCTSYPSAPSSANPQLYTCPRSVSAKQWLYEISTSTTLSFSRPTTASILHISPFRSPSYPRPKTPNWLLCPSEYNRPVRSMIMKLPFHSLIFSTWNGSPTGKTPSAIWFWWLTAVCFLLSELFLLDSRYDCYENVMARSSCDIGWSRPPCSSFLLWQYLLSTEVGLLFDSEAICVGYSQSWLWWFNVDIFVWLCFHLF